MALPIDKLGAVYDECPDVIDPERAKAYAAATNDDLPAYTSGKYAPPVYGVVPTWAALHTVIADVVPAESMLMVVHGEEDMHFHQPLVPGQRLTSRATSHSIRVGSSGTRLTIRIDAIDETGQPLLQIYNTLFVRGMSDGQSAGPDKPDHTFPDAARANPVGQFSVHVDEDQTFRYHKASGDDMPIHLDAEVAKSVGLPGIIAHGLCTMAMTSQAVIRTVADGDPARLKRLAVRFSKNVFPGNDVVTSIYDAGGTDGRKAYAYEAHSGGELVIANGRAEVEV